MCNEQTSINYNATVENQHGIRNLEIQTEKLERQIHDKEMYLDEVNGTLSNRISELQETISRLQQEVEMLKFRVRHG